MGPSCRRSTRKSSSSRSRRALLEKNQENSPPHSPAKPSKTASSTPKVAISSLENPDSPASPCNLSSDCSTPKAKRFRIPEIKTCPPAPKKRRILKNCSSLRRTNSPIAFFAHPDIELFFYFALRGIRV